MASKTIKELIEEVVLEINTEDVPELETSIVNRIETLISELNGTGVSGKEFKDYSADELSRIAGSLAILKINLGDLIAKAKRTTSLSEDILRLKKANLRQPVFLHLQQKKEKPTADDIKMELDRQVFKDSLRATFKTEHSDRLDNLWWSLKILLDVIQTRINVIQGQKMEGRFMDEALDIDFDKV